MRNNLPQLTSASSKQLSIKQTSQKNLKYCPRINVKGITLKEYFRICDENQYQQPIAQIQQQCQSKSSLAETPSFNVEKPKRQGRDKIKTQIAQEIHINNYKMNFNSHRPADIETNRSNKIHHMDKNIKMYYIKQSNHNQMKKKEDRKKIMTKIGGGKNEVQMPSNITLTSFYQHQDNKKKMLKKMQADKQRAHELGDLRLSDAFFITKYGLKFNINANIYKQ